MDALLSVDDPSPMTLINPAGTSSFLLLGDHAGNAMPERLSSLGLPSHELERHIGWDIGIGELGALLAERLDAVFLRQTYSRLVIDCNRSPEREDAIPAVSDRTEVPGNRDLSADDRAARVGAIHTPYHAAIEAEIARRGAAGQETILIALHSFTPAMQNVPRPWHVGVLHDRGDARFAHALLAAFEAEGDLVVGDNEPYRMDTIDYTIPRHAYPERRPYAEIEIRQDLIGMQAGVAEWVGRLARTLPLARG